MKKTFLVVAALVVLFVGLRWRSNRAVWHEEVDDEWRKVSTADKLRPA